VAENDNNTLKFIKQYRKEILIGILMLLVIIFLVQNSDDVEFSLVFWKMDVPLILLLVIWLLIGAVITGVYFFVSNKEMRKEIKRLKKEVDQKEEKIEIDDDDEPSGMVSIEE
jgi:putative membrane protein